MADKFSAGDQVIVSSDFFWATGATGTVGVPPPQIIAVSDSWESDGLTRGSAALWVLIPSASSISMNRNLMLMAMVRIAVATFGRQLSPVPADFLL